MGMLFKDTYRSGCRYLTGPSCFQVREHGSEINARSDSISIGGISAGGTISAVIQQQARDIGLPLKLGKSW